MIKMAIRMKIGRKKIYLSIAIPIVIVVLLLILFILIIPGAKKYKISDLFSKNSHYTKDVALTLVDTNYNGSGYIYNTTNSPCRIVNNEFLLS
jgi:hypothetical protein